MLEFREGSVVRKTGSPIHLRLLIGVLALFGLLHAQAGWSQSTCTWNQNGPGQWDNPSNWNACSGGNGSPAGTPGPADHAVIGNIAPLADIDLGSAARTVNRLTLSAGRIFGDADITVVTSLNWTGGTIDGGTAATQLVVDSASNSDIAGTLHILAKRDLRILGTLTWTNGDIELREDAEIDIQGPLIIDHSNVIRSDGRGGPVPLELRSDFSPQARIHNSSTPGARIEKLGDAMVSFADNVTFDNGNDVLVSEGTLQVNGPGGDFGSYQVAGIARLEFGPGSGVTRGLTGATAVAGSGVLHKFGSGTLSITGGYALTGQTEVVGGLLYMDTPANPLNLATMRVRAPGIFDSPDQLVVSSVLDWNGGLIGGTEGSTLTLPSGASANVVLDDTHSEAVLRLRSLINQGTVLVSATGSSPFSHRFTLDGADIDNQGDFELRSNNQNNLVLDCATTDCASFFNRVGATLRLNDLQGIAVVGPGLTALNNAGLVELVHGCGQINPPGVDTGTYRFDSNCTLAFFTRPDTERVFESTLVLDPVNSSGLQLGGSLRVNGAARSFGYLIIDNTATLFGPAAITFTSTTEWRGLIEGVSGSETVTVAPGATLQTNSNPGDSPLLFARTLLNNGNLDINNVRLRLDGNAEIRNNASLNLNGTPIAAGAIGCASPPNCGLITNTSSGTIQSTANNPAPATQLETDIALVNQGIVRVNTGVLLLESAYTAAAGSVLDVAAGAGLRRSVGNLVLAAGALRGAGVIEANVDADSVAIEPAGTAAGNLAILGNFTATANTGYHMGIAGTVPPAAPRLGDRSSQPEGVPTYDRLTISGSASLNGTLDVFNLGYAATGSDVFDLMMFASRNGSVIAGLNPYSGVGLNLQQEATRLRLAAAAGGGCVWNPAGGGANNWTNPLKWTNCTGGAGPGPGPAGTPGAPDTAIVGGGSNVNLDVPVTVAELQFTGGSIGGFSGLTISSNLIWTGGSFFGTGGPVVNGGSSLLGSSPITLNVGANALLSGGQHNIDNITFALNGSANWTTGLIQLANGGVLQIGSSGVLNSNPSLAFESIFGSGSGIPEVRNGGAINKLGPNYSGIGQSVQYSGTGSISVSAGDFTFAANSPAALSGSYIAAAGATLQFVGGDRSFTTGATLTGGNLVFGDSSPMPGINVVNACIGAGSAVIIRNAELVLDCAGTTDLAVLQMAEPMAVLEGSSAIRVSGSMGWSYGTIRGTGLTQLFEIASGAVAQFDAPQGDQIPRTLSNRRLRNFGTISWIASNVTEVNDGAQFANESSGQLFLAGNGARALVSNMPATSMMLNSGTLAVDDGAQGEFDVAFDNSGSVQLTNGSLRLHRAGSDSGSYSIAAPSVLHFDGAVRSMSAGSVVSGAGSVGAVNGASVVTSGTFEPHSLVIESGSTVEIDSAAAQLIQTLSLHSATLTGNAEIRIGTYFDWRNGGVVASVGASPGPLVIQSGALLDMCGGLCTLSNRVLRIEGMADWSGGSVEVPMGAAGKIAVALGGTLQTTPFKSAVRFRCAAPTCTAEMEVAGSLLQLGDGAILQLTSPLLINGGTLRVAGNVVEAPGVTMAAGLMVIDGDLIADPVLLNGGALRGNGRVNGSVTNVAGRVQPGASPGRLDFLLTYTQGPSGILDIEVGGLAAGISSDFLFVNDAATIDGTLNVINAGHALTAPSTLDILHSNASLSGTFAVTNIPYPGYSVTYDGLTATLTPTAGPLIVNSTGDSGDGICDPDPGECTLRDALILANLMPDPDVINFNIPAGQCAGPGGACVIVPLALLPQITTPISIDGYTQSGAIPNTHAPSLGLGSNAVLKIELDGTSVPEFCGDGLIINAPGQIVSIRGLAIHHYCGGIVTFGPGDASYRISGNFIGLRANGSPAPRGNIVGIGIQGGNVIVGDTSAPAAGLNVISGNIAQGISIQSIPTLSSLLVAGNLIGTAPNGVTALGNGLQGIAASTSAAIAGIYIGGDQPDDRNVISGNVQDGIRFECTATVGNCFDGALVRGNYIGPGADGSVLGNIGNGINLVAMDAGRVTIGGTNAGDGNVIAFNGGNGIRAAFGGVGRASFLRNNIFMNGQMGIDLGGDGRTANDSGDGDTGPNGLLNFPNFTSYTAPGGNSAVINLLLTTPDIGGNYPARVDFYKAVEDEPGIWLGSTTCSQFNVNCPASFAFPAGVTVTPDDVVLGIVTDGFGKSSEASFYGAATTIVSITPEPSIIGTPYTVAVEVISPEPFAPIGSVSIDDGTGNSCQALLSPVSVGRSGGSCQLPSNAPAGARTVTAQYSYDNPLPAQPFTSSSAVVGHTINGPLPVVTSISPNSGNPAGGTVVTVNGTNFEVGSTTINFGAVPATGVSCASSVQCTATSPPGTGVVSVRATTSAGTSADTPADDYTYVCPATVVTSGNDSGVGSLRQIIADACPGSVVTFAGGVGTVDLTTAELFIGKDLSIDGGAGVVVARQPATPSFRIFTIASGTTVVLDSLSINNGNIADDGAGVHNSGNLTVLDSVISGNASTAGNGGGGIANLGTLAVDNTTISLNSASFAGGGLLQINGGSATLTRCTLSGNSAPQGGAAVSQSLGANASLAITSCTISGNSASTTAPALLNISTGAGTTATMTLTNSTIANNTGTGDAITTGVNAGAATTTLHNNIYAGNSGNNVANVAPGVTTSVGNNLSDDATGGGGPGDLINTNPLLAPLGNYGGPTQTHALLPGSPAINAGDNVGAPATDQRGIVRPQLATVDIGAFESRGFALAVLSGTPQSAPVNTLFAQPLVVGVTANAVGEPVNGGQLLFTAPGAGATATFTNPAVIAAAQASITATANSIVGSYSVTAAAAGASGVPTFALQNAVRATTTSIGTIAPLVSVVGQPYTVTVSVLDGSTPVTTGTVEVRQLSDGTICTINLASASSCQLVANSAITTAVRASYLGASGFAPSQSATVSHGVDRAATSVLIASDTPDPSQVLEPVLVTADISVTAPGAGTPTGEVLVTDGTASCSFILPARSCSFVPKALGVATLEARYLGDANFNASVDFEAHTIVVDGADLSIVKRNGLRLVPGGQPSTYILLVSNAGPQGVVNARVTDILPAQFANASWTCSAGPGASCPAAGAGTVDALVSLPAGSSVSFALTATAQAAPEQIVSNRATVTPPANAPDPVSANNESTDTDPIGIFGEGFETEDE